MTRILIVEDEAALRGDLVDFLTLSGYEASGVASAARLRSELACGTMPQVVILDVGLPDAGGFDLAREIRSRIDCGIIMLTALGDAESRIRGFESGADVYLVKHAPLREIAAAVQNLLRRVGVAEDGEEPAADEWVLDLRRWHLLTPDGNAIKLTATELTFLQAIVQKGGEACSRDDLTRLLARRQTQFDNRHLDAVVSRLRRKIASQSQREPPIKSVYGVGYAFTDAGRIET
ncbi:response regulator transcription factor [Breoghania sp. JC706]|uniref:response regulator transcription factor n=1 Tax=Breoghania sp. JC706 TaxID=3117732 RepID=UPI00300ADA10